MVYCGKASQGCQNCRTRRIKCDKIQPQCTQCIRVGKSCPGYRDQLSLMFRDESTKVIQKAHAQWGISDLPDSADSPSSSSSSSSSSTSSTPSPKSVVSSRSYFSERPRFKLSTSPEHSRTRLPKEIYATKDDQAIQFYVEHYVVGHPDEPTAAHELRMVEWIHAPEFRDMMAAVGLASMSNLTGNKALVTMARQKYGLALQHTASSIANPQAMNLDISLRTVIMLAIYEVIRNKGRPTEAVRTHLMGATALLSNFLCIPNLPQDLMRGFLQLCLALLNPFYVGNLALPPAYSGWFDLCNRLAAPSDKPAVEILDIATRLLKLNAYLNNYALIDGRPKTSQIIRSALAIDAELDAWERQHSQGSVSSIWTVLEERCAPGFFPSDAVFEDSYHVYADHWVARGWNHQRWLRLLTCRLLIEFSDRYPLSCAQVFSPANMAAEQQNILATIRRVARDLLVSIPTHYRHPRLERQHRDYIDMTSGGAGMGVVGLPNLLFQIQVAGSAPGVPRHFTLFARNMLETIFADTGMLQARGLAETLVVVDGGVGGSGNNKNNNNEVKQERADTPPEGVLTSIESLPSSRKKAPIVVPQPQTQLAGGQQLLWYHERPEESYS
ncbi:hypothetical protein GE21DRAFT_4902 [Neurospora crassa]|uniref:Zn(2)-C6 fungal-type domain-containing protein n=1 Tax=Neurospora crassa (strain ATCC 24698 / 74-OR23-1A / CBS 708.71 / DSM 1257 / FGSC 987) TaxID=367110 RepID=Q7S117_NEUCR|nr:hypothetical protein NCU07575 [Neurospora crassa OR74A]EAA29033.3 hypothetical protein NCU07575 [Neurospora crassa OR74A]KHE78741.1 hypothetical protein GE21DRAFT_4902 [Neurospora crassa]|eukprot:XP_958269.3 hypothetical protein NCU07575 [Neurospora crassa OR74A]